ncbi:MAG TPA: carboxylating nicotinate-nucleotide diphosphorylase [Thermoplasmata archaeon]|jgi:nicotinate-nucleotide pyrophosphorylase (carboxylating)|nr:carboxylating nicotinate-nucleotide diphosphorylase [Thermoplasmata archaeon]
MRRPPDRAPPVPPWADALARRALAEDRAFLDRTTRAVVRGPHAARARVTAQARGVLSGMAAARAVARRAGLTVVRAARDGSRVAPGRTVLELRGDVRRILAAERTILNLVMHASGVATATRRAVDGARGARPPLVVRATRKTLPGLRDLEKAAVVHGGGRPHRRDLADGILIKNNHLAIVPLPTAVRRAGAARPRVGPVEVEVRTAAEALAAARAGAAAILIDNAGPRRARAIVAALAAAGLRRGRFVELSGGIRPEDVPRYRTVGADAVSLGAVTHSAPAVPFHLAVEPARLRRPRP